MTVSSRISSTDTTMYSEDYLQKKRENQQLENRIANLQNQLNKLRRPAGRELIFNESTILQKQREETLEIAEKLGESVNMSETSVQTPLNMYKDLKSSVEKYNRNRTAWLKAIDELQSRIRHTEQETDSVTQAVTTALAKSKDELGKVDEDSRALIPTLQTQLKVIETKKRSLQSNLEQKRKETIDLTKLCDDLISPNSAKK
uniref:Coiled-coil domain-containing protein 69-like n=1 Tax=Phallusia mammillata TaxID=59560 RepID=A0A6F9D972_9ASCI|nr:coiled-coil domain-containing protein 69-like [Phallusia mammillata]